MPDARTVLPCAGTLRRLTRLTLRRLVATAALVLCATSAAPAQTPGGDAPGSPQTMVPHCDECAWSLSGQLNVVYQAHGPFRSPYEGPHSLRADREHATSRIWTVHGGLRRGGTALVVDVESAGGRGVSDALGVAGFTNLDVVRNPDLGTTPYLARLIVHQSLGRLQFDAGKMSTADYFDVNAAGSDSHRQFLNWTVDNNGAFDYAADTRGYTWGVVAAWHGHQWTVRGGEMLMPTVANGIDLDWRVRRARGENVEVELRPRAGLAIRVLGFSDRANLGSYREALDAVASGQEAVPVIEAHRRQRRRESGAGLNVEDTLGPVRLFGRVGWNDGRHESFAYTEVNDTAAAGGDVSGGWWHRRADRAGAAVVTNGLSPLHRDYLAHGGSGFLLGDGRLTYGREDILESYYTAHLWRGLSAAGDLQRIVHPGYNRDRGPATVAGLRLHVEF